MDNPFDNDLMDESDALAADAGDAASDDNPFDEGDGGDGFDAGDGFDGADGFDSADGFEDGMETDGIDDMAVWDAFEEEIADALDAADEDEFLGRLMGGLGRAAGVVGRGLGRASQVAGTVRNAASVAGRVAGQVGRVAGQVAPAAQAASRLASMLGASNVARGLDSVGRGARTVQGWSGRAASLAGAAGRTAAGAQNLLGQLSQLIGSGQNEFDDFDAMADLFEDGVDEALPPAMALAARAAARGLGFRNVQHLTQAGRRALVRGVASATRSLMAQRDRRAIRALPRLATSAARVASRTAPNPQRAVQLVRRRLPPAAARVAQDPRQIRQLARPMPMRGQAGPVPMPITAGALAGPGGIQRLNRVRRIYIDRPTVLTLRPR